MTNSRPDDHELAAGSIDAFDLSVLDRIEALYTQLDAPPAGLVDRVKFGITLEALHAEIAELQRSAEIVGVRSDGATDVQTISFTTARLTTMVTVSVISTDSVRIDGWAVPGAGVRIELRTERETVTTDADSDGRFVFAEVPRGLAQFTLRRSGDDPLHVVTPSVEL